MNEDISKNTLLVLVVLTIIVSLLGTWTVINEASNVHVVSENIDLSSSTAKVSLDIKESVKPIGATGQVTLKIVERT